jgi:negative regulator of flagellin synthesis FlgM
MKQMIDGIGKGGAGRIDAHRASAPGVAVSPPIASAAAGASSSAAGNVVAALVSAGPPVDSEKVSAIRSAIADGSYRVDPDAVAEHMIRADLGR